MAFVWVVFNPSLGGDIIAAFPIYSGTVTLGISLRLIIFVAVAVGWYIWRRGIIWGLVCGALVATAVTAVVGNPSIDFAQFPLGQPVVLTISTQNIVVGVTKALGYGAMMFVSLMLVMTSRDIEIIGAMRQLRVPYVASFFTSTMLRSLSMALFDYSTIRQAQLARGISLTKKNVFRKIRDIAYMAVPLTATMLRRSGEVGDAALIRGFNMKSKDPTEFHEVRSFKAADWIVAILCTLLAIVVLVLDVNFTVLLLGALQ
jgi:energy-coupling factor transporter transmembrane protein EcfT